MEGEEDGMAGHISVLAERMRGEMMVSVAEDTWEKGREEFKRALVIKMANGDSFNIQGLAFVLKKAWGMEKGVHIWEAPNSVAVARFEEEEKLTWVLDNGPWMFKGVSLLMKRWDVKDNLEELNITSIKIWIQIHGIPLHIMREDVAGDFARLAGRLCKGGNANSDMMRRKFLKFQIELDVNKPVKRGCFLQREGMKPAWIAFKYEKLPEFCRRCGSLKHREARCEGVEKEGDMGHGLGLRTQNCGSRRWRKRGVGKKGVKRKWVARGERSWRLGVRGLAGM